MNDLANKIKRSILKFNLQLQNKVVLTEAASGNYVVTPIIAALAGAKRVIAYTKDSKYASIDEVFEQTQFLARLLEIEDKIEIITNINDIDYSDVDIVTNTGFLRPINSEIISKLNSNCVIPLMWETWEFRDSDLDLEACLDKGIKVYGTNEEDKRLRTKEYIGYMSLKFLLDFQITPINSNVLVLGCKHFTAPIQKVLINNNYNHTVVNEYFEQIDINDFDSIIIAEHQKKDLLIGVNGFINKNDINSSTKVIHICGNVDFEDVEFCHIPNKPASFGYMSYTTDYIDKSAVIDLHTAGLKVAEGMIKCNEMKLTKEEYRKYMQAYYPAMSFKDERYW